MDAIEKRLKELEVIIWSRTPFVLLQQALLVLTHAPFVPHRLKDNYKIGSHGSISKNSVYQHFLYTWQQRDAINEYSCSVFPLSATAFGKIVKKAFPDLKYNRKGPRGQSTPHYTHLKRIDHDKKLSQIITLSSLAIMASLSPPPSSPVPDNALCCGWRGKCEI